MPLARWLTLFVFAALALRSGPASDDIGLVRVGDQWRYFKGVTEPATNLAWTTLEFNDSGWPVAIGGFSSQANFGEPTQLWDYGPSYTTLFFRRAFAVTDTNNIAELILRIDYDDGFVAYINGVEILRRGVPGAANQPVPTTVLASPHPRGPTEEILLTNATELLRIGTNMLAIQVLGSSAFDSTFCFVPELLVNVLRGPYVQNTALDSAQIAWKTLGSAAGMIEFGTNETSVERIEVDAGRTNHVATLQNLLPDTRYVYRVGNRFGGRETWTTWSSFRTFKPSGSIVFNVMGDSGWATAPQFDLAKQIQASPADLLMHLGDINYYGFTHQNADLRCFSVYNEQMRNVPWFVALGNHDLYLDLNAALESFFLPTNSVTGTEHYYSFDHGDVHFVVAWSDLQQRADYAPGSPQYQWLDQDLAATSKPWKFLFFHHTWRSSSLHGFADNYDHNALFDSVQLDVGFGELARKHSVQIVFNGHDHCYERLAPSGGPISFVSGGGGAVLYGMYRLHADSSQFISRHHFLRVNVGAEETLVEAVGLDGAVFDKVHVRRTFPAREVAAAAWNSPAIEMAAGTNVNVAGQTFDFAGNAINAPMGLFTSPGRLFVNNDHNHLYLGFDEVMLRAGQELLVFLEVPGLAGTNSLQRIGNGAVDPEFEGADGLDFLANLSFEDFSPAVGLVLGDEWGDIASRGFLRTGQSIRTGQGAFYLTNGLPLMPGQRLTQFNRSPQDFSAAYEQNSDFIEIAIPYSALGMLKPGDLIKVGAITALAMIDTNSATQTRQLDTGAIGYSLQSSAAGTKLEAVEVRLSPDVDPDRDGLDNDEETQLGTNPGDADSDDDGLTDGWEVQFGFNPLSSGAGESDLDADADGQSNSEEFRAGTNPKDASSRLEVRKIELENETLRLVWSAVPGKRYKVQYRGSLFEPFQDVQSPALPILAEEGVASFTVQFSGEVAPQTRYYRVQLVE